MIKESIRIAMLNIRQTIEPTLMEKAKSNIINQITKDKKFIKAKVIGIYHPIANEIDLLELLELFPDKTFALPQVKNGFIKYYQFDKTTSLAKSKFGILEPQGSLELTTQLNYLLVPVVAISPLNYRIGYGKGYYDKFFIQHTNITKIGIGYYFQEIPFEAALHDVKLDGYFLG